MRRHAFRVFLCSVLSFFSSVSTEAGEHESPTTERRRFATGSPPKNLVYLNSSESGQSSFSVFPEASNECKRPVGGNYIQMLAKLVLEERLPLKEAASKLEGRDISAPGQRKQTPVTYGVVPNLAHSETPQGHMIFVEGKPLSEDDQVCFGADRTTSKKLAQTLNLKFIEAKNFSEFRKTVASLPLTERDYLFVVYTGHGGRLSERMWNKRPAQHHPKTLGFQHWNAEPEDSFRNPSSVSLPTSMWEMARPRRPNGKVHEWDINRQLRMASRRSKGVIFINDSCHSGCFDPTEWNPTPSEWDIHRYDDIFDSGGN